MQLLVEPAADTLAIRTSETVRERGREMQTSRLYMYVHIALYTDIIPPTETNCNCAVAELNLKTCSFLAQNSLTVSASPASSSSWLRSLFFILINDFFFFTFFSILACRMQFAVCVCMRPIVSVCECVPNLVGEIIYRVQFLTCFERFSVESMA